ncbi:MAG: hypothetical protein WCY15_01690 [Phenylobacterium sp.]|jgi:hypothetical protein|uniref:hypothetical protein n=1 Tax=Phenylobacterium sp. TaxID=1871053 RepID=UPI002A35D284|nr:hypothetical protein [Phenylobacterium sp.]MDX9998299.1 hypothetical protein [Phenylobacterium sp.]
MDFVIDTQPADAPERVSADIIDLEACRRARGLPPARPLPEPEDPYPWAYTFNGSHDRR